MDQATILIVDDEVRVLDALEAVLATEFRILRASSGPAALDLLRSEDVAVILTDYKMPGMTGVEMLRESQTVAPEAVRLVLTAYTDVDSLMDAVNTGHIYHFVAKPWESNELLVVLRRAVERHALAQENGRLREELEVAYNAVRRQVAEIRARPTAFDTVIGATTGLREAIGLARKVFDAATTVLLRGETGTGKELFARLIHESGNRRGRKFVAQNCGALSETLLESELFGHARGAFTGAIADRRGLFEEAHGGTIFLDEVGEMTPATQVKLLRVLQEGEFARVGEHHPQGGRTRDRRHQRRSRGPGRRTAASAQDLYYRLNVFPITLPPLRDRPQDIPTLAEHFLRLHRGARAVPRLHAEVLGCLRAYPFPGNVRELENEVERALALADDGTPIGVEHLSERVRDAGRAEASPSTLNEAIEELKRRMIQDALRECGSKTRAAERLGLTRQSLQQMLRRRAD